MLNDVSTLDNNAEAILRECASYARSQKQHTLAGEFEQWMAKSEENIYQIAVIGFLKRGKSTLLNVLLGKQDSELAPVAVTICTAAIVKYVDASIHHDKKKTAVIHFMNGESKEVAYEQLKNYINNDLNRENSKAVKYIKVYGDFPLISSSVALVDTPGRGSVHKEHDILSDEFLPLADAIILVQSADLPMEIDERKFLSSLPEKEKRRIFVVLTKKDRLKTEKDRTDSENFVRSELNEIGIPCSEIYYTGAKKVLDAMKTGDTSAIERESQEWGIKDLERAIESEIKKNSDKNRLKIELLHQIEEKTGIFISEQTEYLKAGIKAAKGTIEELEQQKHNLTEAKQNLETISNKQGEELRKNWNKEIRKFEANTDRLKEQIVEKLVLEIDNKGLLQLWQHGKGLQRRVSDLIHREMLEPLEKLQERLESSLIKFAEDLDETVDLVLKKDVASKQRGVGSIGSKLAVTTGVSIGTMTVAGIGYQAAASWTAAMAASAISQGTTVAATTAANAATAATTAATASVTAAAAAARAVGEKALDKTWWEIFWGGASEKVAETAIGATGTAVTTAARNAAASTAAAAVTATEAAATATSASVIAASALSTAIFWSVGGIASLALARLAISIGGKMLTSSKKDSLRGAIPKFVDETMPLFVESARTQLESLLDDKIKALRDMTAEKIEEIEGQNEKILEALQNNNPAVRERMEKDLEFMESLKKKLVELNNGIRLFAIQAGEI